MKKKSRRGLSVIGGADGPTSIIIAGKSGKQPLRIRIKNAIYRHKRRKAAGTIIAHAHTLSDVVQYAMLHYEAKEANPNQRNYIEQQKNLKESLILRYKPELLGEMSSIPFPDSSNEESARDYIGRIRNRSKMIAEMPDDIIPMDYHLYEIEIDDNCLEIEIEHTWNIFAVSYSGDKKAMRQFQKISKDLYTYYGVSENDIRNKTERYKALLAVLSS